MGSNCFKSNANCVLLFICFLQLAFTLTRQVFDFFGHIWASILFNFFAILVTICGCFGGCEKRNAFLYIYCIWQIITFFWNVFIICFYLEIGSLFNRDKDLHILNFGTGSRNWFESNGPLCQPIFNVSNVNKRFFSLFKPTHVEGCLLYYFIIETIQAAIQIILAIIAFFVSYMLIYYSNHKSKLMFSFFKLIMTNSYFKQKQSHVVVSLHLHHCLRTVLRCDSR
ncbi:sodium/potassium-transporting ATPase subunit beta-1-interacting protein 1-like protein [Leptotrombidium deliense]|uniref:Sodium/potassium-transporting ATPase subunit beta-1-interacting protein n=1 Tax=Leptotrombidium deliense TaxID=299467 RepID=A0A443SM73_9ACAR|nr:sodium/potassium-transporting ATPase subunit beta-1-interacting protein 1-like protein [Leptotrombidium deliense]